MKIFRVFLFLTISPAFIFAQKKAVSASNISNSAILSNIIRVSDADSVLIKIEVKDALYDAGMNNFPYYLVSRPTAYSQNGAPTLIIKKVATVTGQASVLLKKNLGAHLTSNFELLAIPSLSQNENLNYHRLYPFRLNARGEVEELLSYDLNWQISPGQQKAAPTAQFKANSVLASGTWYKIGITKTGIYKIDRNFLISMGINPANIDPRNIRIYGNGGKAVPELNSAFRYDDLEENAISVSGESDGVFDPSDFVLFYATDVNAWTRVPTGTGLKFNRVKNYYSDTSFYFLNFDLGTGKRITTQSSVSAPANVLTSSYDYFNYHETDAINFIKSGRQFFGEVFDITNSYTFPFNDGSFITNDTVRAEISVAARGGVVTDFIISGNGTGTTVTCPTVDLGSIYDDYAKPQTVKLTSLNDNPSSIAYTITKNTAGTIGWMDYLIVNARRALVISKQTGFRDTRVCAPGKICEYTLTNAGPQTMHIWNVTDPINPFIQQYSSNGNQLTFRAAADSLMHYAASPDNDLFQPTFVGSVPNQNLHASPAADYVIIAHPLFVSHAQRLANLHQQQEGFSYVIATTDKIFNEFGSGKPEAAAIRDFIRMLYTRHILSGQQPKYVALLGDGSYNNKNRSLTNNSNAIPTYQSFASLSVLNSTTADDFYGLMDPNEGAKAEDAGVLDIGLGRLICKTTSEMNDVVSKIESYYRKDQNFTIDNSSQSSCSTSGESPMGDWRNWLMFLGDDEDAAIHMSQANSLALQVKNAYPVYNIDKIFLDAYQRFSTPGGHRYPDAEIDMNKRVQKGVLLFNYTGHGGEVGLTSERVLDIPMINAWSNANKLNLFVTATCEFSRYDDPGRTSAGELCLLNPRGGSVALMTTCRLAFSSTNFVLNQILLDHAFKKLPNGKYPTLGDIIRKTKANLTQSIYYANFHLLGDPALTLAYPKQKVFTSSINNVSVTTSSSDTLSALDKITVKGFVADTSGNKLTGFNGIVYPTVFDKEQDITGLLNDPGSYESVPGNPFKFKLQKNILYRGKAQVTNGDFSFTFMVPKDISFAFGPGKISYYATNGSMDAAGVYTSVVVGGGSSSVYPDAEGPQVDMYLNEKNFVNGGTTNERPVFYAQLIDSSGINTLGTGIGHDISIVLDKNSSKPVVLNDYYEADLNSYQSGRIRYPFEDLSEGTHNLSFKVWDIQNNSSAVGMDFVVAKSAELALNHVLNYPNPFTSRTKFFFEHNQACNPLKVTVQIFTISGKVVKTIQQTVTCEGFRPEGIEWDGKDDFGDKLARGIYIYKVGILDTDNKKAEKTEKLVILN